MQIVVAWLHIPYSPAVLVHPYDFCWTGEGDYVSCLDLYTWFSCLARNAAAGTCITSSAGFEHLPRIVPKLGCKSLIIQPIFSYEMTGYPVVRQSPVSAWVRELY